MDIDDGSPDHSQLGASNFFTRTVDICASFPCVETIGVGVSGKYHFRRIGGKLPSGFGVIDAFELKQACVWICISLSTTVAQVTGSGVGVLVKVCWYSFQAAYLT